MLHLHAERLAALADDTPTPLESAHLENCPHCAGEVDAYRNLVARASSVGASALPVPGQAPLTDWSSLASRMRREGMLPPAEVVQFPGSGESRAARRPSRWRQAVPRLAAAVLLLAAGTVFGRLSAGVPMVPAMGAVASAGSPSMPASEGEALLLMAEAEAQYRQAAAYLASMEVEGGYVLDEPEALQARLAALDEVGAVTREALHAAPHDPVINQYYLAAQSARAATIRQIDRAGAPTMLVGSY